MTDRTKWIAALIVPFAILVASFAIDQRVFEIGAVEGEIAAAETAPVELYDDGQRHFFFTTYDLFHPEAFEWPADASYAVAIDLVPTREAPASTNNLPTWLLQLKRLVSLQDADGLQLPGLVPNESDRALGKTIEAFFLKPPTLARGDIHVIALPEQSTVRRRSQLAAFVFLAVARPLDSDLPPKDLGLDAALRRAAKELEKLDVAAFGLPCINRLSGSVACQRDDWELLVAAAAGMPAAAGMGSIVFGGWAKVPKFRVEKAAEFAVTWAEWRKGLLKRAGLPVQRPLRVSAAAIAGGLAAAAAARVAFSWTGLLALAVLCGGLLGAVTKMAEPLLALWTSPFGARWDYYLTLGLAFALGLLARPITQFDPKKFWGAADRPKGGADGAAHPAD